MSTSVEPVGAVPPPPGVQVNFVDPLNRTKSTIVLHTVCLTAATLGIAVRIYTRQFINRQLRWDDCEIVPGEP